MTIFLARSSRSSLLGPPATFFLPCIFLFVSYFAIFVSFIILHLVLHTRYVPNSVARSGSAFESNRMYIIIYYNYLHGRSYENGSLLSQLFEKYVCATIVKISSVFVIHSRFVYNDHTNNNKIYDRQGKYTNNRGKIQNKARNLVSVSSLGRYQCLHGGCFLRHQRSGITRGGVRISHFCVCCGD